MEENKKPSNPSVYPWNEIDGQYPNEIYRQHEGLSLRDKFAGQAMLGLISNPNVIRPHPENGELFRQYDDFTRIAYEYADAMLKQREK